MALDSTPPIQWMGHAPTVQGSTPSLTPEMHRHVIRFLVQRLEAADATISTLSAENEALRKSVSPPPPTTASACDCSKVERMNGYADPRVHAFLQLHPDAFDALAEAPSKVSEVFGSNAVVRFEAPRDEDACVLFLRIRGHGLDVPDALRRLEENLIPWWESRSEPGTQHFIFDVAWDHP